jgi:hypothetical protein
MAQEEHSNMAKKMRDSKIGPSVAFDKTQKPHLPNKNKNTYSLNENSKKEADRKRGGHVEVLANALHGKDPYKASHKL